MDLIEKTDNVYRHPWELSRMDIIFKNIKKLNIHGDILDIGCGDCFFDKKLLSEFSDINSLYGIDINLKEPSKDGKAYYFNNYEGIKDKKFDFIFLMDVMEHVEDDIAFMKQIKSYLKPSGTIIITVPAFQFLYSTHDQNLKHFRRYDYKTLEKVICSNNLCSVSHTYFYFSLFLVRLFTKNKRSSISNWKKSENNLITRAIRTILNLDYHILNFLSKFRIYLPGLSLFCIVKNQEKTEEI